VFTARYGLNLRVMYINPSKPSGHYMYHQFNIQQFYVLPHTVCLCVLCGSQNKKRLFPYTDLTDWFYNRDGMCLLRGTNCTIFNFKKCGTYVQSTLCCERLISVSISVFLFVTKHKQQGNFDLNAQKLLQWSCSRSGSAILKRKDILRYAVAGIDW
jgi:hypothetical protein